MKTVQTGDWSNPTLNNYAKIKDEISVYNGVVLKQNRIIIPNSLREQAIALAHTAHQGIVKTKQLAREKIWFPGIDKMIEEQLKTCIPCQAAYSGGTKRDPILSTRLPKQPWDELSIDFTGPFPSGEYLFVVIDDHSRYPEVEIVTSTSTKVVTQKLDTIFARFGIPRVVKSDNGPPFNGNDFANYAKNTGFTHRKITPLWPEANGEAERFMRTLNKFIRTSQAEGISWEKQLSTFLRHYREHLIPQQRPHLTRQ